MGGSNASAHQTPTLVLLGAPAVVLANGERLSLERHDAALMALLVLDGPQARQDVATLLWPAVPQSKAMTSLRQRLFRLRRAVGHALVTEDGALQLAEGVSHDLDPLASLDDDAVASPSEFSLLAGHHHPAGEPLSERLQALRERWQQARAAALESRADALEAAGDLRGALRLAQRLRAGQPASEQAARRCMHLHYLLGDRGQALEAYARCRDHLQEHLGLAPDDQTRRLARLIESSGLPGRPPAVGPVPSALARPPRLVGRERLWAQLQTAASARLPVLLRGEPGIGKTRLVSDFARSHGRPLVVRPTAEMGREPYAMAQALLTAWRTQWAVSDPAGSAAAAEMARFVPAHWHWGPASTAAPEKRRLAWALGELLSPWAGQPGACLVVDDVQWADAASLELLLAWLDGRTDAGDDTAPCWVDATDAAKPVPPARPAVILTVRPRAMPAALQQWLQAESATQAVLDLSLGPLDAQGLADLLDSLQPGDEPAAGAADARDADRSTAGAAASAPATTARAQDLLRRTGGHPYIALELLRQEVGARQADPRGGTGLAAATSDARLRTLLVRRIGHLPAAAQQVLQVLSVAGSAVPGRPVQMASGLAPAELDLALHNLAQAQLLDEDGRVFDVVAEAMASDIPAPLARRLHERLALARAQAGDAPAHVAAHWRAAQRWPEAAQAFVDAAQSAQRQGRPFEALSCWDDAADAFARAGQPADHAWALQQSLDPAHLAGPGSPLLARLDRFDAVAATDAQRLAAALARARALLNASDGRAALAAAQQALALARRLGDARAEVVAVAWLGLALALTGQQGEGLALLRAMREQADSLSDPRAQLDFHGALGYALHLVGDYAEALDAFRQSWALALAAGDLGEALEQAVNSMVCLNSLGRRAEALAAGEQMRDLWQRMGRPDSVTAISGQVQLAVLLVGEGRFAEALDGLLASLAIWRRNGPPAWRIITEHRLARLYLCLGQPARASQVLSPLEDDRDAGRAVMRVMVSYRIAQLSGQVDRATLQQALARHGAELSAMDLRSLRLLLAADAPADEALTLARQVCADAERDADEPARHHALLRMALAHAALGQGTQAAHLARQAWTDSPPQLLDSDRPTACWWTHQAALAGGDAALASRALQAGQDWLSASLPHVPEAMRSGFLELNPVHRALMLARAASV